jgi:Uma2 family endonuclease
MEEMREVAAAYEACRTAPTKPVTFEEFLAWCDEDTWAEWVDGEVVVLTPASVGHQNVKGLLYALIREFLLRRPVGRVLMAPFVVRLPEPLRRAREPDVLYVSREKLSFLKETYLDGAPDLVIEVVSPESLARDRGEKYLEYEAAGVKEYWVVDPERRQAEFHRLAEDGRYRAALPDAQGVYHAGVLPGFRLKVEWLWLDPAPSVLECLKEMGVL